MSDSVLFGLCFFAVVSALAIFSFYHIYRGVHGTLASADIGDVYNFRYWQPVKGEYERYLAKIVGIRRLDKFELGRLDMTSDYRRYDKEFKRSPTLVTCEMGNGEYRQFYAERSDMCRRPLLGRLLFSTGVAYLF